MKFASTPKRIFMPMEYWFPFSVECMSGHRFLSRLFVEEGALIMAASMMVPSESLCPFSSR